MTDSEIRYCVEAATDSIKRVVSGNASKEQLREIEQIMQNLLYALKNR